MDYWDLRDTWDNLEWCEGELRRITAYLEYMIMDLDNILGDGE